MKRTFNFLIILTLLLLSNVGYSQYSNFYNINSNIKINGNVNHNITSNIREQKTITTIDYGALELANAQQEKNRIENEKLLDERERYIRLEIANNPIKAFDYGDNVSLTNKDYRKVWGYEGYNKVMNFLGYNKFTLKFTFPHKSIFKDVNGNLMNFDEKGITTSFDKPSGRLPKYVSNGEYEEYRDYIDSFDVTSRPLIGIERMLLNVADDSAFGLYHKLELSRSIIAGNRGYRITKIYETKFEIGIKDTYICYELRNGKPLRYTTDVNYTANKNENDFEQLEGRRHFLKPLIEKVIATYQVNIED